jgi:hypothetical protein
VSLLTAVQTVCKRTGIPVPAAVVASLDSQVQQLWGLADEVVEDIIDRWSWRDLINEATFTTINGEDQGSIATIAGGGAGYRRILNDTIYNRTLHLPLFGPLAPQEWQMQKSVVQTGPFYQYRLRGGRLLFNPDGIAGHLCAFEYITDRAVLSSLGDSQTSFLADTDTFILDEKLLVAGLRWKWKEEKGLDYAEDFARYENLGNNYAGRDGTAKPLSMNGSLNQIITPGIFVSPGNWNV